MTRRHFFGIGAAGVAGLAAASRSAVPAELPAELADAVAKLEYLTPVDKFRFIGRGTPPPRAPTRWRAGDFVLVSGGWTARMPRKPPMSTTTITTVSVREAERGFCLGGSRETSAAP
ncbi:MAG: hypothetical protein WCV00_24320 [Verrucomicrobiia bacterium]